MSEELWVEVEPDRAPQPLSALLVSYRERLERLIDLRIDPRLRGRIDAADVVQEAYLDVAKRLEGWRADPQMPFFVWVRFLTVQRLVQAHRDHLGAAMRAADREIGLESGVFGPEASAHLVALGLADSTLSPSQHAARDEQAERVRAALERLKPIDRETLALRHFEQLTNQETAAVLGLSESAAAWRYLRAIEHMRAELGLPDE
jgi:RNA polymerase sigma-70 factor (ECF subfamily)